MLTLVALVAPAGLDACSVAAGLALAGLEPRDRRRVLALFPASEVAMVGIGLVLGSEIGGAIAGAADLAAAALLGVVGLALLLEGGGEAERARRLLRRRGLAVLLVGAAVGLDELGLGLGGGLLDVSRPVALAAVAGEAAVATPLGLWLGTRVSRAGPALGRLGGAILVALALGLAAERL